MTDKKLEALFRSVDEAPVDEVARRAAINDALAAFDDQGSADTNRPTTNITSLFRRSTMKQLTKRWVMSGLASAAVLVVAVAMVFNIQSEVGSDMRSGVPTGIPFEDQGLSESAQNDQRIEDLALEPDISGERQQDVVLGEIINTAPMAPALLKLQSGVAELSVRSSVAPQIKNGGLSSDFAPPSMPKSGDSFEAIDNNPINLVSEAPVSTFSIDVDTASYSFVRRQLNQGVLPQKAAVRLEEIVNYFPYDYEPATSPEVPFATHVTVMDSPWKAGNQLVHLGIKGFDKQTLPGRSNIVFLLDVSGSMRQPDKLPLVKQSMSLLLSQLHPEDTVAIAVYAGATGTVLEPTKVKEKQKIISAMNQLQAGGSTAGAAGIKLAYQLAEANLSKDGVNRVFIATDGDFNVGITSHNELKGFIERKRDRGIYLSVLGFGQGNYQDGLMQQLAQNGNGIAAYIDTLGEAQKVLVDEARSTLFPIANDVKIQVEFNPAAVKEYRLLGYETRMLAREDFNNDKVDAGEIGSGHSVTAIYEITPVGGDGLVDDSRYGSIQVAAGQRAKELGFLKLRYKLPGESASKLVSQAIPMKASNPTEASRGGREARFAVAAAGFAQLLRGGKYLDKWSFEDALAMAIANKGEDAYGYRAEFTQLIRKAMIASEM
ncbi:MAG: Ca-activated chloride channel family protein [Candidatus Azotimanducaceae bacterium]|jgi:Ca-activated chloride channel family protein